jgi:hypothetical protein
LTNSANANDVCPAASLASRKVAAAPLSRGDLRFSAIVLIADRIVIHCILQTLFWDLAQVRRGPEAIATVDGLAARYGDRSTDPPGGGLHLANAKQIRGDVKKQTAIT